MKIGYLGTGAWGFALSCMLAKKGHEVIAWSVFADQVERINSGKDHPSLPGHTAPKGLRLTTDLKEALTGCDLVVESVTAAGIRDVFLQVKEVGIPDCPIILTSKGIEQDTCHILSEILIEVLGENSRKQIGSLSGPSFANDVVQGLPTSVVMSAYDPEVMEMAARVFRNESFRIYTNPDIKGVSLGGALKNIAAIACGIAEGLGMGMSARAALMTRGLHEMTRLAVACGAKRETLYGLSGMGDLCLTCNSETSRNFQFGMLLAKGNGSDEAKKKIGMAVEGAYTAKSALQLSQKYNLQMPITQGVYSIIYENLSPKVAASAVMNQPIKEELL